MIKKIKLSLYLLITTIFVCVVFFSYDFTKKIKTKLNERDILLLKDYRGKLLPNTQFLKIFLKKIPLNLNTDSNIKNSKLPKSYNINNKFFIELVNDKVLLILVMVKLTITR